MLVELNDHMHMVYDARLAARRLLLQSPTYHVIQCTDCGGAVSITLLVAPAEVGYLPPFKQCRCREAQQHG